MVLFLLKFSNLLFNITETFSEFNAIIIFICHDGSVSDLE